MQIAQQAAEVLGSFLVQLSPNWLYIMSVAAEMIGTLVCLV